MQSRMDRYNTVKNDEKKETITSKYEANEGSSRQRKNQKLYQNFGDTELDNFDVDSNVSIIGKSSKNIDIDNLRDMLDRKYKETPKEKVDLASPVYDEELTRMKLAETREYDLTKVLEKVKSEKEVNYEEERLMKLHNTQYDILKNLDIYKEANKPKNIDVDVVEHRPKTPTEQRLQDLIDTITENEFRNTQELALDMFSDLTGDDENTKVLGAMDLTREINESRAAALDETFDTTEILNKNTKTIGDLEEEYERTQELENLTKELSTTTQILSEAGELLNEMGAEEAVRVEPRKEIGTTTQILMEAEEMINDLNKPKEEDLSTTQILLESGKMVDELELPKQKEIGNTTAILNEANKLIEDMELEEKLDKKTKKKKEDNPFEDFADLKEDSIIINLLIKIIIILIVLLFIGGCVYLANNYFDLGLF